MYKHTLQVHASTHLDLFLDSTITYYVYIYVKNITYLNF